MLCLLPTQHLCFDMRNTALRRSIHCMVEGCYIHGDGTFDFKIRAVVVWGGGNLYNLDEMERQMIFYKTMKKNFFPTYSVLEKSAYHLIVAISVELPIFWHNVAYPWHCCQPLCTRKTRSNAINKMI